MPQHYSGRHRPLPTPTDHASYPKRHQWRGPPCPLSGSHRTALLRLYKPPQAGNQHHHIFPLPHRSPSSSRTTGNGHLPRLRQLLPPPPFGWSRRRPAPSLQNLSTMSLFEHPPTHPHLQITSGTTVGEMPNSSPPETFGDPRHRRDRASRRPCRPPAGPPRLPRHNDGLGSPWGAVVCRRRTPELASVSVRARARRRTKTGQT